ncbi:MAG: aspartate aminotransferase family protein [Candidatus Sumerlaeia bacterium]|nr:aspartate aminotransferase family protein [Candidatus Sumerlaeia bacterium]
MAEGERSCLMRTYREPEIGFVRGRGAYLYDEAGRRYLDFIAGLGVNILGHCPPAVVRAVCRQAGRLLHASNLYRIDAQERLARILCGASFADRAFFCNSGAEAIDTILKAARLHFYRRGERQRRGIICFEGGFHGRTYGATSVTHRRTAREGFGPLLPGIRFAKFNDLASVESLISSRTCLVLVEPVLGEGGVIPARRQFLRDLRQLCDRHGALLAFDEIQCGLSRIGTPFAYQHYGVVPDFLALAKGLAGGLPMGAVLAREPAASAFQPGTHGSTFGGNPLSCAAALAVCQRVLVPKFAQRVRTLGEYLRQRLRERLGGLPRVREIRGMGLMVGIELSEDGQPCVEQCRRLGLLIHCTAGCVLRLLPPLIVTRAQIENAVDVLQTVLSGHGTKSPVG